MMRNSIRSLGICALLATATHAQSYKPFITPGKQFSIYYQDYQVSHLCAFVHYYFQGDTVLKDGFKYKKLYGKPVGICPFNPNGLTLTLLREDTVAQQVIRYPVGVIWDFSLSKGDTATIHQFPNFEWKRHIDSIAKIILANGDTVRQFLDDDGKPIYTESVFSGVDDLGYFLAPIADICNWGAHGTFLYKEERFGFTNYTCDPSIYITINERSKSVKFQFTNPVKDILKIWADHDGILELYDLTGKQVLQSFCPNGESMHELPVIPTGLYVVSFHSQNQRFYDKLIIQH